MIHTIRLNFGIIIDNLNHLQKKTLHLHAEDSKESLLFVYMSSTVRSFSQPFTMIDEVKSV